jgi:hypothetical protein
MITVTPVTDSYQIANLVFKDHACYAIKKPPKNGGFAVCLLVE